MEAWPAFVESLPVASEATLTDGRAGWAKLQASSRSPASLAAARCLPGVGTAALSSVVATGLCLVWRSRLAFEIKAAALATGVLLVTPHLFLYDLVVLGGPDGLSSFAPALQAGSFAAKCSSIGLASLLILIFPLVTAPVGLAAILLIAGLIVRRALSGAYRQARVDNCEFRVNSL